MNNNKQSNASITALICSAAALIVAIFFVNPAPAPADLVVKDRDYQVVTASLPSGGDGLYILDNRTGQIAVFKFEQGKQLEPKVMVPIGNAFAAPR